MKSSTNISTHHLRRMQLICPRMIFICFMSVKKKIQRNCLLNHLLPRHKPPLVISEQTSVGEERIRHSKLRRQNLLPLANAEGQEIIMGLQGLRGACNFNILNECRQLILAMEYHHQRTRKEASNKQPHRRPATDSRAEKFKVTSEKLCQRTPGLVYGMQIRGISSGINIEAHGHPFPLFLHLRV